MANALEALWTALSGFAPRLVGAGLVVSLQNTLATSDFPVTIATGLIFMVCVLIFRRGIVGELRSSFDAWIKLYRRDENFANSVVEAMGAGVLVERVHAVHGDAAAHQVEVRARFAQGGRTVGSVHHEVVAAHGLRDAATHAILAEEGGGHGVVGGRVRRAVERDVVGHVGGATRERR